MRGNEMVNGQHVKCYDNGGKTCDRYSVYYIGCKDRQYTDMVGMSAHPFHPQGFGQHGSGMVGPHNGRRIAFTDLPADCQRLVQQDTREITA